MPVAIDAGLAQMGGFNPEAGALRAGGRCHRDCRQYHAAPAVRSLCEASEYAYILGLDAFT